MPKFTIESYELYAVEYRVAADNKVEALRKFYNDEAQEVDNAPKFLARAEEYGMPADKHPELAESEWACEHGFIPGVRDITADDAEEAG